MGWRCSRSSTSVCWRRALCRGMVLVNAKQAFQAQGIGRGKAKLPGFGAPHCVKDHVEPEETSQNPEQWFRAKVTVAERHDQHGENQHVDKRFSELAVVHSAQTGHECCQNSRKRRIWCSLDWPDWYYRGDGWAGTL